MIELLALASAVCYGSADFFGGITARRANTIATVFWSQFIGLVLLAIALPFLPAATASSQDWIWGFIAGFSGGIGVALLYRALAVGTMAVVAPTTAVIAAMIPVLFASIMGERLGLWTLVGVGLALAAILLVSRPAPEAEAEHRPHGSRGFPPGFGLALLSGMSVGVFFLSLARTSTAAGMWPLIAARLASIVLFGALAVLTHRTLRMDRLPAITATTGGALDMLANVLYLIAARVGPLSIVVTLASLYPAATVLLARFILRERLSVTQMIGLACALAAVMLIVSQGAAI